MLAKKQKGFTDKPNNRDGIVQYGHGLRYGKFAVVFVAMTHFSSDMNPEDYSSRAFNAAEETLNKWQLFEDHITKQTYNKSYFNDIINPETKEVRQVLDYDGYYKGGTINKDLKNYFDI